MASKPFYSIEEVCEKLGKTEDEVKGLVRAGDLREFRDAGKVFFKSDDIDKFAGGGSASPADDDILLEPSREDTVPSFDELPGLSDSSGGTSIIGLEPLEGEGDTPAKSDTAITSSGVGVFDDDELEMSVDPMADTQITDGTSEDQVSLEGAGSGSGLLDLAREADDTALGADLLDEIYPGEDEDQPPAEEDKEPVAEAEEKVEDAAVLEAPEPVVMAPAVVVAVGDPSEGSFSGLMVGSLILMAVACTVLAGELQGFLPDFGFKLSDGNNFYYFLGGSALTVAIAFLAGWLLSRAFAPRRK